MDLTIIWYQPVTAKLYFTDIRLLCDNTSAFDNDDDDDDDVQWFNVYLKASRSQLSLTQVRVCGVYCKKREIVFLTYVELSTDPMTTSF